MGEKVYRNVLNLNLATCADKWYKMMGKNPPRFGLELIKLVIRVSGYSALLNIDMVDNLTARNLVDLLLSDQIVDTYDSNRSRINDVFYCNRLAAFFEALNKRHHVPTFFLERFALKILWTLVFLTDCDNISYRYLAVMFCLKVITGIVYSRSAADIGLSALQRALEPVFEQGCTDKYLPIRRICIAEFSNWIRLDAGSFYRLELFDCLYDVLKSDPITDVKVNVLVTFKKLLQSDGRRQTNNEAVLTLAKTVSNKVPDLFVSKNVRLSNAAIDTFIVVCANFYDESHEEIAAAKSRVLKLYFTKDAEMAEVAKKLMDAGFKPNE